MEGFTEAKNTIENQKEKNRPSVLLRKAINALREIDKTILQKSEEKTEIEKQIEEITRICESLHESIQ